MGAHRGARGVEERKQQKAEPGRIVPKGEHDQRADTDRRQQAERSQPQRHHGHLQNPVAFQLELERQELESIRTRGEQPAGETFCNARQRRR